MDDNTFTAPVPAMQIVRCHWVVVLTFLHLFLLGEKTSPKDEMKTNKDLAQRTKSFCSYNRLVKSYLAGGCHKNWVFWSAVDFNCSENKCGVPTCRQGISSRCKQGLEHSIWIVITLGAHSHLWPPAFSQHYATGPGAAGFAFKIIYLCFVRLFS